MSHDPICSSSPNPIPQKFIERLMYLIHKEQQPHPKTMAEIRQQAIEELLEARENGWYEERVNMINWEYRFAMAEASVTS